MLSDEDLLKDKTQLQERILDIENAIALRQQELQQLQTQIVRLAGVLAYVTDNLKGGGECSEET